MRRVFLTICAALAAVFAAGFSGVAFAAFAAEPEVGSTEWRVSVAPAQGETAAEDGFYDVVFEAVVTPGWHLYDMGPYDVPSLATMFDFSASSGVEFVGDVRQLDEPVRKTDEVFGFETGYFEGTARFVQRVRFEGEISGGDTAAVLDEDAASEAVIAGEIEYQICKNEVGCVRGVWEFAVNRNGEAVTAGTVVDGAAENGTNKGSLWAMILEAILWGFAALLTPCVFPMAPMTVSFFMKDGASAARGRMKALLFGLFIVLLYTLPIAVIILVTLVAGGEAVTVDIFNWLATHWVPNVLFFVVFMLFAASLLGAFEIRMPSKLVNRSDRGAEKGGLAGVFFLALTLVLVSFSCTGPIVGTVLIKSTQGEFWAPILTMLCFSAAFALPFTLLAFFPRLMEKLPRSGGWLNSVKVVLGFVEIALGLKFLSVADQTYHWGILDREVYLAIWIVVFTLLGFYLLGKLRFKLDSPVESIGVGRLAMAIAVFAFVVWLVPGMWGAPLSKISGYLPPMSSQEFVGGRGGSGVPDVAPENSTEKIKYADVLHLPHGMSGYFDLEQGLEAARRTGKPVFLDFTGHGCVNCREMEERVWVDAEVQRILREKYIVVALYSDDRTQLPAGEWLTTPSGKTLKTLGRKNSYIVNTRYGVSSQPAYILLDAEGEPIAPVYGYDLSVENFVNFLHNGK